MRSILPRLSLFLFVVSLVAGVVGLAGCSGSRVVNTDAIAPASIQDVRDLAVQVDKDRENTADGFKAVKSDLEQANIAVAATGAQVGKLDAEIAAPHPTPTGIGGALVNALGGSLPGWLDWVVTLVAGGLGINVVRNKTSPKRVAAVVAKMPVAPKPPTPTV